MTSLKREAVSACEGALRRIGFVKRRGSLVKDCGDGAQGWVGLNLGTYDLPKSLFVNPVVGVSFKRLDALAHELRDDIPHGPVAVISRPLGYLMPQNSFHSWEFSQGGGMEISANSLANAVQGFGKPYIEKYGKWEVFCHEVEKSELLMEHESKKYLPMIIALNGDIERARELVRGEQERVAGVEDAYAQSYTVFAGKFLRHFTGDH